MRKLWKTVLRILDGSPGAYGIRQRGQSLLELAFITPLLFILFLGTVEVGWFANHILILLEVTRVGARAGTVLTGELSPLSWNEDATIHPIIHRLETPYSFGPSAGLPNVLTYGGLVGVEPYVGSGQPDAVWATAQNYRGDCNSPNRADPGFYNYITCAMLDSMDPLSLWRSSTGGRDDIGWKSVQVFRSTETEKYIPPDDIIISGFSFQFVNNSNTLCFPSDPACPLDNTSYARTLNFENFPAAQGLYPPGYQVIVVGRYPKLANECNVVVTPSVAINEPYIATVLYPLAEKLDADAPDNLVTDRRVSSPVPATFRQIDRRDPFDYIPDRALTFFNGRAIEIADAAGMEIINNVPRSEFQRGYILTGQHIVRQPDSDVVLTGNEQLFCMGSEFSDAEVVDFMNLPGFLSKTTDVTDRQLQAGLLPSQGMILVEMFWHHTTLLNFPFITTMLQMFGDTQRIEISAWAAFPLPQVEPSITYQLPPED
jgi:hypothetical protein